MTDPIIPGRPDAERPRYGNYQQVARREVPKLEMPLFGGRALLVMWWSWDQPMSGEQWDTLMAALQAMRELTTAEPVAVPPVNSIPAAENLCPYCNQLRWQCVCVTAVPPHRTQVD